VNGSTLSVSLVATSRYRAVVLYRRLNAVLLAVLAYLLSAWFFTFVVFCVVSNHHGADMGWMTVLLIAPAMVPMLLVQEPGSLTVMWFGGVVVGAVVFFRVLWRWRTQPGAVDPKTAPAPPPHQ
jgi:hypothetical protein